MQARPPEVLASTVLWAKSFSKKTLGWGKPGAMNAMSAFSCILQEGPSPVAYIATEVPHDKRNITESVFILVTPQLRWEFITSERPRWVRSVRVTREREAIACCDKDPNHRSGTIKSSATQKSPLRQTLLADGPPEQLTSSLAKETKGTFYILHGCNYFGVLLMPSRVCSSCNGTRTARWPQSCSPKKISYR